MDKEEAKARAAGLPLLFVSIVMFSSVIDSGIASVGMPSLAIPAAFGLAGLAGLFEPGFGQILLEFLENNGEDSRNNNNQEIHVHGDNNDIDSSNAS